MCAGEPVHGSMGIHDFGVFLAAGVLLNLTPGQDTLYIVGRSLAQGRSVGVVSALGISTGGLIHTIAAALGLSAVLATSASAFTILKFLGAGYLIYLGVGMILGRSPTVGTDATGACDGLATAYRQGILTNVANPKVALFFLAFMPQFIDPDSPSKIVAFLALGLTFLITSTIWCLVLAVCAARIREVLAHRVRSVRLFTHAAGALFIALGLRLAASTP